MEVKALGRIRKLLEGIDQGSVGDDEQLALTPQLEQLVALGASPYGEITRLGRAFFTGTTTAVAAVVAVPTTAVMLALYNNASDGGRSMIIDWVAASGVAKTAAAGQAQLLVNVGQVRETAPTDAALAIKKANGYGQGTNDTVVRTIVGGTALPSTTGIAGQWIPWGPAVGAPGAAATPGDGLWAQVDGRLIVPPGATSRCTSWPMSSARRSRHSSAGTSASSCSGNAPAGA
jgi:hypothetical protein